MTLSLWQILLIGEWACCDMVKRNRETESSSRLVNCHYCDEEHKYKDLKSHCENHHGGMPVRVKGVQTLGEFFARKATKRAKTSQNHQPSTTPVQPPTPQPSTTTTPVQPPTPQIQTPEKRIEPSTAESEQNSSSGGIMKQLSGLVLSLLQFVSPFKEATLSLERSAAKIEVSHTVKQQGI